VKALPERKKSIWREEREGEGRSLRCAERAGGKKETLILSYDQKNS